MDNKKCVVVSNGFNRDTHIAISISENPIAVVNCAA